jgi:hypothetical protein
LKVIDTEHEFFGYHGHRGHCRIQVYLVDGERPLIVAQELIANDGTSITNMVQYLAAEVIERYLTSDMLDPGLPPFIWLEVYERDESMRRAGITPSWSSVVFKSYTRERVYRGMYPGGLRFRYGEPDWTGLDRDQFAAMISHYGGTDEDAALGDLPPPPHVERGRRRA